MKRFFTPALLLLCAGIIVLGAFLPNIAAGMQDRDKNNIAGFAVVNDVALTFEGHGQDTFRDKLAALRSSHNESLEVPESMAKLDNTDATRILRDTLTLYQNAGLIPPGLRINGLKRQPYLVAWGAEGKDGHIFWNVEADLGSYRLTLVLDDETEGVLSIHFEHFGTATNEGMVYYLDDSYESMMAPFCQTYFSGLGEDFAQADPAAIARNATAMGEGRKTLRGSYSWSDVLYGQTELQFLLHGGGFFVTVS